MSSNQKICHDVYIQLAQVVVGDFFEGAIVACLVPSLLSLGAMGEPVAEANRPVATANDENTSPVVSPDKSVGAPGIPSPAVISANSVGAPESESDVVAAIVKKIKKEPAADATLVTLREAGYTRLISETISVMIENFGGPAQYLQKKVVGEEVAKFADYLKRELPYVPSDQSIVSAWQLGFDHKHSTKPHPFADTCMRLAEEYDKESLFTILPRVSMLLYHLLIYLAYFEL